MSPVIYSQAMCLLLSAGPLGCKIDWYKFLASQMEENIHSDVKTWTRSKFKTQPSGSASLLVSLPGLGNLPFHNASNVHRLVVNQVLINSYCRQLLF
jgi:hypothetical protein